MAWDKALPNGALSIAQGDDDIRANNEAIEDALDLEHAFTTGGTQSGRHSFTVDTQNNIDAMNPVPVEGGLAIVTGVRTNGVLSYYNGSAWVYVDNGNAVGRLNEEGNWTAPQNTQWVEVTPSGSNIPIDLNLSSCKYTTISGGGEATVANPTNSPPSGYHVGVILQITFTGAGNSLAWGTSYFSPYGVDPPYDDSDGAINYFFLTRMQSGAILVTTAPGAAPI